jgi:AAA15 family ATPase/GTPase
VYTSFGIKNFRCFEDLTIEPLARVNLIAGQNNVGKTALLEALWVHAYPTDPRRATAISGQRGLSNNQHTELLADWFPRYQTHLTIRLKAAGNWSGGFKVLEVNRRERTYQAQLPLTESSEPDFSEETITDFDFDHEVSFEYINETGEKFTSSIWLDEESALNRLRPSVSVKREPRSSRLRPLIEMRKESSSPDRIRCEFVRPHNRQRHLKFSMIERQGYLPEVEEVIRLIEPKLQRMTLITNDRGLPSVYGDIGIGALLPMALMGDGTNRLLDLALGFLPARDGIILIDEIETGIHHSRLETVWKNLDWLSREFNVQVFATTHSYECIVAANNAFNELESDELHLHRLYRRGDQMKAVTYNKDALDTNIEYLWELR